MKRIYIFLCLSLILMPAVACSPTEPAAEQHDPAPETHHHNHTPASTQLDITFQSSPDHPGKNQPVELKSVITAEKDPVENAQVEYEVWKQGEQHEMIKASHQANGIYVATKNFPQDGQYHVIVHVTAPGIHQMINGSVLIGESQ
ncbi:FixH family protein [Thermoactinomyces mirandus]|uniref:FixH family protein n=1 Tax=Thermoactinomyces mirandus TaxID=2756294 RepID=A0A7W2ARV7_9BACL|nr:FixH family protein [Thermoactinomyces mirandus]MBA4603008.1 FixH family protein [Thermoactinomyces mirandus]